MTWPLWPGVRDRVGVHRFLLARFPFAVGYIVQADGIVVLAIAHVRRRPGYWFSRLTGKR